MKTVFSNDMLAHVWAQLSQPHGRSNSMKFDGAVAYSYAEPVAHIAHTPSGARVALFTSKNWSMTTGRHISRYRAAVRGDMPQFVVPDIFSTERTRYGQYDHAANVAHLAAEYNTERDALLRAPCDSWRLADTHGGLIDHTGPTAAHESLKRLADVYAEYCALFNITAAPIPWKADAAAVIARRDRLLNDPQRQAKIAAREAARAKREAEQDAEDYARNLEQIGKWRDNVIGSSNFRLHDAQGGALLRIGRDGLEVETSLGARVPITDAKRAFDLYQRIVREAVLPYTIDHVGFPQTSARLGQFKMDVIETDGSIRAGCHRIHKAEILALAKLAGWQS